MKLTGSGTYALVLRIDAERHIPVGALGGLDLRRGYCVYVGSAFGPGGVAARLRHHARPSRRPHWHIDSLRRFSHLEEAWVTHDLRRREHDWALTLRQTRGASEPMPGFGSSDCRCPSHLFHFSHFPPLRSFRRALRAAWPAHARLLRIAGDREPLGTEIGDATGVKRAPRRSRVVHSPDR